MKLDFIAIDRLYVDKANMRHARRQADIADILPSIRKRGVLQSLIVRPADPDGRFGIVAGSRRFRAATLIAGEHGDADAAPVLLPCAILDEGDDAAALEASLIENMARLDPDEVSRWESFVRLVKQGQSVDDIAATFALPALAVRRTLALGNLLPRIRDLYRREKIDAATVRQLTLASIARQKEWLALLDDPDSHCPTGWQLKSWLFGGTAIRAGHALFDVGQSGLTIVADLFGEERWFADSEAFWRAQDAQIEARRTGFLEAGWREVVVVPPSETFSVWEHEKTAKRKGGRVYIDVRSSGEVSIHEGYLRRSEARKGTPGAGAEPPKAARPEVSGPLQVYIDLHRHAAVRAALVASPGAALRLMVAHAIAGSHLFRLTPEPQQARSDQTRESVETSRGETLFDEKRRAVLGTLGLDPESPTLIGASPVGERSGADPVAAIFRHLLDLSDGSVMDAVCVLTGEALASGSAAVEAAGQHLGVEMANWWTADTAFLDLLRDREVTGLLVAEVAGDAVARANEMETGKTLKRILADHLAGNDGRKQVEHWVPRWMAFPPAAYTQRGGVGTVSAAGRVPVMEDIAEPQALAA